MEQIAEKAVAPGVGYSWTGLSYQGEARLGHQIYYNLRAGDASSRLSWCWRRASTRAGSCGAGCLRCRSRWCGTVIRANGVVSSGLSNICTPSIGLVMLIALSAKNAILIVEVARERRIFDGKPIIEAALEAGACALRPILMTSFAFIMSMLPRFWRPALAPVRASRSVSRRPPGCDLEPAGVAVRAVVFRRGSPV